MKKNNLHEMFKVEDLTKSIVSVGTFKPKFNPQSGKIFSDELQILGTAFFTNENKTLVTCNHVIQNLLLGTMETSGLLVVGYEGKYYRAGIGVLDVQHDLAILKIIDVFDFTRVIPLKISTEYKNVATPVAWAGYPLGNYLLNQIHQPTYSEGIIGIDKRVDELRKNIQISGTVVGGYSGSPVIEKSTGEVIGVVADGPQNTGIFMAVSFEHINAIISLANS